MKTSGLTILRDGKKTVNKDVLFSTGKAEWATPQDFFDKLNEEFHFDLDTCATDENHKCDTYFTQEQDGLKQDWEGYTVFCNPPYGRVDTGLWVKKCAKEASPLQSCCHVNSGKN